MGLVLLQGNIILRYAPQVDHAFASSRRRCPPFHDTKRVSRSHIEIYCHPMDERTVQRRLILSRLLVTSCS